LELPHWHASQKGEVFNILGVDEKNLLSLIRKTLLKNISRKAVCDRSLFADFSYI
jgi:hypothetical protein